MKRIVLCILFLGLAVLLTFTANRTDMSAPVIKTDVEYMSLTTDSRQEIVSVLICANSTADLSLQQNTNANNLLRRYRPVTSLFEEIFLVGTEYQTPVASGFIYRNLSYRFHAYFAQQKLAGYYIYTLCKIII